MWRKSSFCNGASTCVEVAPLADGNVAVRDSKLGDVSPVLRFTADDWREFQRYMDADNMGNYLGPVWFSQVDDDRWEMANSDCRGALLVFDDGEAEAFLAGLFAGEFTPEALAAGDGSDGDAPKRAPRASLAGVKAASVSE
ncbi:DUF397 domain-containing protein [Nonomuraea sp. NPDC049400]|uniref:DUF397 domain-containing protein n=1 Tax=Nonomuraea sp. NPDC049400 TaxID=3364352 RepID=UPI0037A158A5